jgi:hypothetical protein
MIKCDETLSKASKFELLRYNKGEGVAAPDHAAAVD